MKTNFNVNKKINNSLKKREPSLLWQRWLLFSGKGNTRYRPHLILKKTIYHYGLLPACHKFGRWFSGIQMLQQGTAEDHGIRQGVRRQPLHLFRLLQTEAQRQRQAEHGAGPLQGLGDLHLHAGAETT